MTGIWTDATARLPRLLYGIRKVRTTGSRKPLRSCITLYLKGTNVTSMSRKGNCWDNAVAESFFSSIKKERIYKDRQEALADVAEYIDDFYNPVPWHSHLGGLSPDLFEAAHRRPKKSLH